MTTLSPGRPLDSIRSTPRVGPLGRLARVTFRHRGRTVLAWLAAPVIAAAVGADARP